MPIVVLLLVLFYFVFGKVSIGGIVVAVIGFTLTFGSSVFSLMKMGVGTVDRGQYEAAYALGHSNSRTFFRIILPQAVRYVLPAVGNEFIALLKETSVAGYVAVVDLTRAGNLVRNNTHDMFNPLMLIALMYLLMVVLLTKALGILERRLAKSDKR